MLGDLRSLMLEETNAFLDTLCDSAGYPIAQRTVACGELSEHILAACRQHDIDLVIYGNHNQGFWRHLTGSVKRVVSASEVDVLVVPL